MTFEEAKAQQSALYARQGEASRALRAVPGASSGPMGLTSDAVKARPDYREASRAYAAVTAEVRRFNGWFLRAFKAELRAERRARRPL